jgi:hypothetical protein
MRTFVSCWDRDDGEWWRSSKFLALGSGAEKTSLKIVAFWALGMRSSQLMDPGLRVGLVVSFGIVSDVPDDLDEGPDHP